MNSEWLGARVRELREQAGLTQSQLGEKMGVQRLAVARWESGDREPGWSTILELCRVFSVDCTAFTQEPAERESTGPGRPRKAEAEVPGEKPVDSKPSKAPGVSKAKRSGRKPAEEPGGKAKRPRK